MNEKTYFLTCDLESTTDKLDLWIDVSKLDLKSIRSNTINLLEDCIWAPVNMMTYEDILEFFKINLDSKKDFIISLDNEIYVKNADFYYDSTRTYSKEGDIINNPKNYKITKRDWWDTKEQYKELSEKYGGQSWKKVILCDDGIFSWDTLKNTIENLKEAWIYIDEIVVWLNFSNDDHFKVSENNSIPIKSINKVDSEKCYDWIDERDFFYGTPMSWASVLNGRWVYGVPYISTPQIAQKKASIPVETSQKFCKAMLEENQELRDRIWDLRWSPIKLRDLTRLINLLWKYNYNDNIVDVIWKEGKNI